MKNGDRIHGFLVTKAENIKELCGDLYTFVHEKSGARLLFADREDPNKTFSIAFKTPPSDDTGVFHIIEHAVLCGSEKFPVKEPFVELLKGSLNTFLNAMTYEDRTVYPVSSRCNKDFLNLVDIYLDAVFHPLMKENESIFMQEGWRYEIDEKAGELSYNGVVYNEMKGAYSSPDELGYSAISKLLYGDSCYARDSGGAPAAIPTLTYEGFKSAHDKYYHPSNSYIYLDGSVDLDSTLALIDSYLSEFERKEVKADGEITLISSEKRGRVEYEASEDESKARLLLGYIFSDSSKPEDKVMATLLISALTDSNDSPLTKALLDSGLCEDVNVSVNSSRVMTLLAEIKGVRESDAAAVRELFDRTIREACEKIERDSLIAALNRLEFKTRERDLGSFPVGVANALSVYEIWTYGNDPADAFRYEDMLLKLRRDVECSGAEKFLAKAVRDNECRAELLMVPSSSVKIEEAKRLKDELQKAKAALGEDGLLALKKKLEKFDEWQATPDSEESLATIPSLALSDIEYKVRESNITTRTKDGARILEDRVDSHGIVYATLFLEADDLSYEELPLLSLLASLLTNMKTESYSVTELKNRIKSELGAFSASCSVIKRKGEEKATPTLRISASVMREKESSLTDILREVLFKTKLDDCPAIKKILLQTKLYAEELFISNGESLALGRLEGMCTPHGAVSEALNGYDNYLGVKRFIELSDSSPKELCDSLAVLLEKITKKERLIVSTAADEASSLADDIIAIFPTEKSERKRQKYEKNATRTTSFATSAATSFATAGGALKLAPSTLGLFRTVRSLLSYEYLWSEIRVKGGAYGAGFIPRRDGGCYFYSYRDPSPERTLGAFEGSCDYLVRLADSGADLTKFIIGAYGEYDLLATPKTTAVKNMTDAISGWTAEDESEFRRGLLEATPERLKEAAEIIRDALKCGSVCVVGAKDTLATFTEPFDVAIEL